MIYRYYKEENFPEFMQNDEFMKYFKGSIQKKY